MGNSETFAQLQEYLFKNQIKINLSRREIIDFILSSFLFFNSSNEAYQLKPFPGKKINHGKKEYFIHGIFHDGAGIKISKEFKEIVKKNFKKVDVICEDGLEKHYNLDCSHFNESSIYSFIPKTNYLKDIAKYLFFNLSNGKKQPIIQEIGNIKDMGDFIEVRKKLNYLPEPLGLTIIAAKQGYNSFIEIPPKKSRRVLRYILESKQAINYAREKNLQRLHILVGYSHENPLAYLISNPDKIETYLQNHNISL